MRMRYDTGWCWDAASAPDERRLSGPAIDSPPADWTSPGVSGIPWKPGRVAGTGDTLTQDTPVAGTARLDDAAGAFVAEHVGHELQIASVSDEGNAGSFVVTAVNSATQLEFSNPDAVTVTESFVYSIDAADGYEGPPVDEWDDTTHPGAKLTGTGDDITAGAPCTLVDAAGAFTSDHVGRRIKISGATNSADNGTFPITAVLGPTTLNYTNASAVGEIGGSFTYQINPSDNGYGTTKGPGVPPTKSWRHDVELPDGWYTRITRSRKGSGDQ